MTKNRIKLERIIIDLKEFHGAFATLPQGLLKKMVTPRQYKKLKDHAGIILFDGKYAFLVIPFLEAVAIKK